MFICNWFFKYFAHIIHNIFFFYIDNIQTIFWKIF